MEPITTISGGVSVLDRANVDTDQIIPKQFLKRVERTGFGEFLFYDWAQESGGTCPQSDPRLRGELRLRLVARARCRGRSRTTASGPSSRQASAISSTPTAPRPGSCRSSSTEEEVRALGQAGEAEIDLDAQEVRFGGRSAFFAIHRELKHRLLNGLRRHRAHPAGGGRHREVRALPRALLVR